MRAVVLILLTSALIANANEVSEGRWEGKAEIPGLELALIVDLTRAGTAWSGAITIPELGVRSAELTDIAINGSGLTCATKSVLADKQTGPARLKGHLSPDGKLSGEFTQAGNTAPFNLAKTGPAQIEVARRSTAIAKEFEGVWKGSYQLLGYPRTVTLTLRNRGPEGAGAEFVIVGRKENNLPVDLITQHDFFLSVNSNETGLSFEGQLKNNELHGIIIQGPIEIPLTLQHAM
jgi:hypothetical protein